MDEQEYRRVMGLDTQDIGSVKTLRAWVDENLVKCGYRKLRGWRSMKELIAIKAKVLSKLSKKE